MIYTGRRVKKLIRRLKEEYEGVLREQKAASERYIEENRVLSARVKELEAERGEVAEALISAHHAADRIKAERLAEAENDRKEQDLLLEKCRLLSDRLLKKYPREEDVAEFAAFIDALRGEEGEESGFRMEDVLSPKGTLDLGELCKSLGLMEEEG